jgi:Domain of unknown function (DUF4440)
MRKMIGILVGIVLSLAVTEAQEKPAAQPNDQMLIGNERALYEAVAKADEASFVSLVLPDGVWTTKEGWVPMKLLVGALQQFKLSKWDFVNPGVRWLGDDSAIVFYVWTGAGTFHDQPLASMALALTVWTKRNGKWLAVHHQETDLAAK